MAKIIIPQEAIDAAKFKIEEMQLSEEPLYMGNILEAAAPAIIAANHVLPWRDILHIPVPFGHDFDFYFLHETKYEEDIYKDILFGGITREWLCVPSQMGKLYCIDGKDPVTGNQSITHWCYKHELMPKEAL